MDLELSADEEALQDGVRRLCEGRFPMATVRALASQAGVDRTLWRELANAGVFSLRADGLGATDAVLVFEELGRALQLPGLHRTFCPTRFLPETDGSDRFEGAIPLILLMIARSAGLPVSWVRMTLRALVTFTSQKRYWRPAVSDSVMLLELVEYAVLPQRPQL